MTWLVQAVRQRFCGKTYEKPIVVEQPVGRRYSMLDRPNVDKELVSSIVKIIRLNEQKLLLLEMEEAPLVGTQIALRTQITDLTKVLEEQWLLVAVQQPASVRRYSMLYPNNLKSREFDKERALNLSQAKLAPKQLNLNKLSDAGGSQIQWLPTPSKTDFSGCLGIDRSNVDRELVASAVKTIRLNERKLLMQEMEEEQLIATHASLRGQITELSTMLEKKWLVRGERVALAVSALVHKFQTLHHYLSIQDAEAQRIQHVELGCLINHGKDWDRNALRQHLGPDYMFVSGISYEIRRWWGTYSCLYLEDRLLTPLEQLNKTFGDTLAATITTEVQKIREEMLQGSARVALTPTPSTALVPFPVSNEVDGIVCQAIQEQSNAQGALWSRNLQAREKNSRLEKNKEDLYNIGAQFTARFQSALYPPCLMSLYSTALTVIRQCQENIKDHPQRLAEMDPWDQEHGRFGAAYKTGLELAKQISPPLQEMVQLVAEIKQGCPTSTT